MWVQVRLWLQVKLFPPHSKLGSGQTWRPPAVGAGRWMSSGWRGGSRGGAQPIQEEDEAQQEVKSQHLSLSQLLQVTGSFPRLSVGSGTGRKAGRDRGAQPQAGTATPVPAGTLGTVTLPGILLLLPELEKGSHTFRATETLKARSWRVQDSTEHSGGSDLLSPVLHQRHRGTTRALSILPELWGSSAEPSWLAGCEMRPRLCCSCCVLMSLM